MTKRIVPGFLISETSPAPECTLSEHDVEQFVAKLETYFDFLVPAFHRRDQFAWGEVYSNQARNWAEIVAGRRGTGQFAFPVVGCRRIVWRFACVSRRGSTLE